ncbi:MAG: hypothetical protein AAF809_10955 [Bacteroidota bacterium]
MTFILDNLAAILVGTTLLVALITVQQRARFDAADATARYAMEQQNQGFIETLRRDFENMRTRTQAIDSLGYYELKLRRGGGMDGVTRTFSFPTLADPALGEASPVAQVHYRLEHTGVWVGPHDTGRWLYQMVRYVDMGSGFVRSGGSAPNLWDFRVDLWRRDGTQSTQTTNAPDPVRIKVDLETVSTLPPERVTADQEAVRETDFQRQSYTIRPLNIAFNASDETPPPTTGTPPPLPPEPPVPTPPPPPPPASLPGTDTPGTGTPGSGAPGTETPGSEPPSPGTPGTGDPTPGTPGTGDPTPGAPGSEPSTPGLPPGLPSPGNGDGNSETPTPGSPGTGDPTPGSPNPGTPPTSPSPGSPAPGTPSPGSPTPGSPPPGVPPATPSPSPPPVAPPKI